MNATVGGLFDGCGLLAYGLHLAGWKHRWLCELDEFRQGILRQRFPGVPVYPDIRALDGRAERPVLIAGGFPCKGGSTAGKREGLDHPETALWHEMARVVRDVRPRFVLIENVANLLAIHDGAVWGTVLGDLAEVGYDVEWDCLPAAAFGAPHLRDRVFAVATDTTGEPQRDADDKAHAVAGGWNAWQVPHHGVVEPSPDPERDGVRQQSEPEPQCSHTALAGDAEHAGLAHDTPDAPHTDGCPAQSAGSERRGEPQGTRPTPTEPNGGRRHPREHDIRPGQPDAEGCPVGVEWAKYEPAIRRWEHALGRPAGEPLLQGVVARSARGVVRSRLSALGDGVQVQAGYFVGRLIMDRLA